MPVPSKEFYTLSVTLADEFSYTYLTQKDVYEIV